MADNSNRTPLQKLSVLSLFTAAALMVSCSKEQDTVQKTHFAYDPSLLSGKAAMNTTAEFVSIYPRHSGSSGAAEAAAFIAGRLEKAGLSPVTDTFTRNTPVGNITFRNVTALIQGVKSGTFIIASHYDTKRDMPDGFTGANDSGSSTGLLLEIARLAAAADKPVYSIMFAFLDGEECARSYSYMDGLHGSRRLLSTLEKNNRLTSTKAVIVLDMVGDKNLDITLPANSTPSINSRILKAADKENVRSLFSLGRNVLIDDHKPFYDAGIPASNLIDFNYGATRGGNEFWHSAEDTIDKLSPESLQVCGRVIFRVLNSLMSE